MYPAYLKAHSAGRLRQVTAELFQLLSSCSICPHRCKVNRLEDKKGFCGTGLKARVYNFMPHYGEEPPISGEKGSGTIFFSGCNMRCVYCQNYSFSQQAAEGKEVEAGELAGFMLNLQQAGCHNINLVTPTHVLPQILAALELAVAQGLKIPLVYNTSGYELPEMIQALDGIVDIYLPDMRYADNDMAFKYSKVSDYPRYNQESVVEMYRQVGLADIDGAGIITRGLIIRHLVLPGGLSGTQEVMRFIADKLSPDTYISLMSQYTPYHQAQECEVICRRITRREYRAAQEAMEHYQLHNGWTQAAGGLERFAGVNIKPNV